MLLTAGVFQFSRAKNACLTRCRSPLAFFLAEWRDGNAGALKLGLRHGSYCVGCCWALMALMFVAGAMNLLWMGVLMIFILGEKLAPPAWRLGHVAGVAFLLGAAATAARFIG
jgi:predicted metal-binding membrane protein